MAPNGVDSFFRAYLAALREENAAVFAGAGLSIPAGMVDWRELLRDVAEIERERIGEHGLRRGGRADLRL